ncbi:putative hydrogenase nickel incorporation protein HybF [Thiohalobacter sp. COW1]|uniref:Hydrogenase maturation factor HypA n=1 Tax=Thiohalobacter thiocyanaticus TaxID=585455 RepID=A0A1Z4VTY0_9GAMM|nr:MULTISPECIES: hydrogenase maturation nickel metallochaperone HypA [Thiohalobacter]BAZ94664.1 hydrogenase nickel insertion protein HypA [Thiohalobacter thiocyanaticus]BCO30268.1 putative hydrogenase nickel incorporation protein HybF [Thiohalobacter sp. COW1]
MHELSVCQGMLRQVSDLARRHRAERVSRIVVRIGPLAGVEPELLRQAFPIASAGTLAASADLVVETDALRVHCNECGTESEVRPNRLLCNQCGSWQTRLISGDELLLASVEFIMPETESAYLN